MKLIRGEYPGASLAAYFDVPLEHLSRLEMKALLENILHRAWPGSDHADMMLAELAIAEEAWRELTAERVADAEGGERFREIWTLEALLENVVDAEAKLLRQMPAGAIIEILSAKARLQRLIAWKRGEASRLNGTAGEVPREVRR